MTAIGTVMPTRNKATTTDIGAYFMDVRTLPNGSSPLTGQVRLQPWRVRTCRRCTPRPSAPDVGNDRRGTPAWVTWSRNSPRKSGARTCWRRFLHTRRSTSIRRRGLYSRVVIGQHSKTGGARASGWDFGWQPIEANRIEARKQTFMSGSLEDRAVESAIREPPRRSASVVQAPKVGEAARITHSF